MFLIASGGQSAEIFSLESSSDNLSIASLFGNPTEPKLYVVNFATNLFFGSVNTSTYAIETSGLPDGSRLRLNLNAGVDIFGRGGAAGAAGFGISSGGNGGSGGTAMLLTVPTTIDISPAGAFIVAGAGGGGGGGGSRTGTKVCTDFSGGAGGDGAGSQNSAIPGSGVAPRGGDGGALASNGDNGAGASEAGDCAYNTSGGIGGSAGNAILTTGLGSVSFIGSTTGKVLGNIVST